MALQPVQPRYEASTATFLLQVDKGDVGLDNEVLHLEDKDFQPKKETHITVIGSFQGPKLLESIRERPELEDRLRDAIQDRDWQFQPLDTWYLISREKTEEESSQTVHVESIIRMVEVPGIEGFFQSVSDIFDMDLDPPPTHVTLYTYHDPEGIAISTKRELELFIVREVQPNELP